MRKLFYFTALIAVSLLFVQCEQFSFQKDKHEYVDLGLSVKWATCNVGAENPEDNGNYYAWGETETRESYFLDYKFWEGSYPNATIIKYNTDEKLGDVDNKSTLDLADDAAYVNWGGKWRMPTKVEMEELVNNCTWQLVTKNSVFCYSVTGPNGNSIFLPLSGYKSSSDKIQYEGTIGQYWSSSLDEKDNCWANVLVVWDDNGASVSADVRSFGFSIRPVCE